MRQQGAPRGPLLTHAGLNRQAARIIHPPHPGNMFGFLNCDKPIGFSSRDLVNIVQGRLRGRKVKLGHCGTLDPLASGVLVVGVGPAARLTPFVHEASKSYQATFRLAAESPTGDMEFEPTLYPDHPIPTAQELASACRSLTGMIEQIPPAYSAIKVDGKRAYVMAREGSRRSDRDLVLSLSRSAAANHLWNRHLHSYPRHGPCQSGRHRRGDDFAGPNSRRRVFDLGFRFRNAAP